MSNKSGGNQPTERLLEGFPLNEMDSESSVRRSNPGVIRTIIYGKRKSVFINGEMVRIFHKNAQ